MTIDPVGEALREATLAIWRNNPAVRELVEASLRETADTAATPREDSPQPDAARPHPRRREQAASA